VTLLRLAEFPKINKNRDTLITIEAENFPQVSTNVCTYFPGEQEILGRNSSTTKRVPSLKRQEDEAFPGRCV